MSGERIALQDLHVPNKSGGGVTVVRAGHAIPKALHDRVGDHAYVVADAEEGLAAEAKLAADEAEAAKLAAAAKAKAEADKKAADDAEAAAKAKAAGETPDGGEQKPAGEEVPYDPSTEPEHGTPYASRTHKSLQAAAKARGLKADGNGATLAARLEADDRETADNE